MAAEVVEPAGTPRAATSAATGFFHLTQLPAELPAAAAVAPAAGPASTHPPPPLYSQVVRRRGRTRTRDSADSPLTVPDAGGGGEGGGGGGPLAAAAAAAASAAAPAKPFKLRVMSFNLWAVPFVGVATVRCV